MKDQMNLVQEEHAVSGSKYLVTNDGRQRTVRIRCSRPKVTFDDGLPRTVIVFYDTADRILYSPSIFLLNEFRWDSENTLLQATSALKLLLSFSSIIGIRPEDFDLADARAFLQFARGTLGCGFNFSFELVSRRSEATLSAYLATIRKYVAFLGVEDSPFNRKKTTKRMYFDADAATKDYVIAARLTDGGEVPRYVSEDEYRTIVNIISSNWTIEENCIVRLMYEHGLRIGEVLGLTLEDVKMKVSGSIPSYSVVLRNRVTDHPDQHAKSVMRVSQTSEYGTVDYKKRNVGYQEVRISENLYHAIVEYIEISQLVVEKKTKTADECSADSVESLMENRYLFLNSRGRTLTANLWGRRLRLIFIHAGLRVDCKSRKTNLNHKFRHGYAMFLIRNKHLSDFEVKILMRHKSLRSTDIYNRPTEEDVFELQELVTTDMSTLLFGSGWPPNGRIS